MNLLEFSLKYARWRYIIYRIALRVKNGRKGRDNFIKENRISIIDFLPERVYNFNGIKIIPRKGTHDFAILCIPREQFVKANTVMQQNETFVDVGANVGPYTLEIAHKYPNQGVAVIAIEAHPENCKALTKNIEINGFKNVIPVNKAVADHKGTIRLYDRQDDRINNRIQSSIYTISATFDGKQLSESSSLVVECDTLDNILAGRQVDVLKMDIEGAEVRALNAASETLQKLRKVIVEVHNDQFDEVTNILVNHGFDIETMKNGSHGHVIGSKQAHAECLTVNEIGKRMRCPYP